MIDFQSSASGLRHAPLGHLKIAQPFMAGFIVPNEPKVPPGTTEIFFCLFVLKTKSVFISFYQRFKKTIFPFAVLAVQEFFIQGFPRPFKAIKGYPSLFKGFLEKYFCCWEGEDVRAGAQLYHINGHGLNLEHSRLIRPIGTYSGLIRTPSPPGGD
jgi:hypothetical protein